MGKLLQYAGLVWRWAGHISLAQWLWSLGGGAIMGLLTWIGDQPLWLVAFVALGTVAIVLIILPRLPKLSEAGKGSEETLKKPDYPLGEAAGRLRKEFIAHDQAPGAPDDVENLAAYALLFLKFAQVYDSNGNRVSKEEQAASVRDLVVYREDYDRVREGLQRIIEGKAAAGKSTTLVRATDSGNIGFDDCIIEGFDGLVDGTRIGKVSLKSTTVRRNPDAGE